MRAPRSSYGARGFGGQSRPGVMREFLTFGRLMTGPVTHLIYWAGLGLIALVGFGIIGGAIGLAIRGGSVMSALLAIPTLVAGLLVLVILTLLWRGACEFFLAVFSIAEDLRALRDAGFGVGEETPPHQPAPYAQPRAPGLEL